MDQYDEAIKYLTENPKQIKEAWHQPTTRMGGCLFDFFAPAMLCLTQVKERSIGHLDWIPEGWSRETFDELLNDDRIPMNVDGITVESLPVFAEWQRRLSPE
jgi:hypothetical protein